MKINILIFTLCLITSPVLWASTDIQKTLLISLGQKLSTQHTLTNNDLIQPIASVTPHYNPFTHATLIMKFASIEPNQPLNSTYLKQTRLDVQTRFKDSQQQAKTLSHHVYQLERQLAALKQSKNNQSQIDLIQQQLSELTIEKAKVNNQYTQNKLAVLNDVIATNTLNQLQKQISFTLCQLTTREKTSLKNITFVLSGIQNTAKEITWHFAHLQSCTDHSLEQQALFEKTRLSSTF